MKVLTTSRKQSYKRESKAGLGVGRELGKSGGKVNQLQCGDYVR